MKGRSGSGFSLSDIEDEIREILGEYRMRLTKRLREMMTSVMEEFPSASLRGYSMKEIRELSVKKNQEILKNRIPVKKGGPGVSDWSTPRTASPFKTPFFSRRPRRKGAGWKMNSVPSPSVLMTLMFSLCAWMISLVMERPRPVPFFILAADRSVL